MDATSADSATHPEGLLEEPAGNPSARCGQVKAAFTDPTWPDARHPSVQRERSTSGRSTPNANNRGWMPNAVIGGGPAATTENRQGSPTLKTGLAKIGALLRSSSFFPLKPTRACSGLSDGSHPNSRPTVMEPSRRSSMD